MGYRRQKSVFVGGRWFQLRSQKRRKLSRQRLKRQKVKDKSTGEGRSSGPFILGGT